jgi:Zn-dependent protease/CBS domain-containing protein
MNSNRPQVRRSAFHGSFKIATIRNIPILIHFSFLLILPFLGWAIGNNIKAFSDMAGVPPSRLSLSPYVLGIVVALALFASVLLHELGHSFVAAKMGIRIRSITLMLFGGIAQLEEMPRKAGQEAKIAIAGPVVSMVLGLAFLALLPIVSRTASPDIIFSTFYLGQINIVLAIFNLVPAFPMDGGRILRSLLAKWKPFSTATTIAANVGKALAIGFGLIGLFVGNLFLVLIAFFVYVGASQENKFVVYETTLAGLRVRDLMTSAVKSVLPRAGVAELVLQMFKERHTGYPVVENGKVLGCVTEEDIAKLPEDKRATATVEDIMTSKPIFVAPNDEAFLALKRMNENQIGRLPVIHDGILVGILSRTDILRGFRLTQLQAA